VAVGCVDSTLLHQQLLLLWCDVHQALLLLLLDLLLLGVLQVYPTWALARQEGPASSHICVYAAEGLYAVVRAVAAGAAATAAAAGEGVEWPCWLAADGLLLCLLDGGWHLCGIC
jgi:hypothetical protein